MNLTGKSVLVTGGALRIGAEIVRAFASEGASIALHYFKSDQAAQSLLSEIGANSPARHFSFKTDLADPIELAGLVEESARADVLVNNAAIYRHRTHLEEDEAELRAHLEINLLAPLTLMKAFCKNRKKEGIIINILDERVCRNSSFEGGYELSKKALHSLLEPFALLAAPLVRVNAVAPGAVLPPPGSTSLEMKFEKSVSPLKSCAGTREIADACIFLAKNDHISGQTIYIDAGRRLNG